MTIELTTDDIGPPLERCCFCRTPTRTWATAVNVAVCAPCSKTHADADLPSKEDWCANEAALTKHHI